MRVLLRAYEGDAVLVAEPRIALDQEAQVEPAPHLQPGAAVGERIGLHHRGGVERRPHALAGLAVPGAGGAGGVHPGGRPERALAPVGAAVVASADEGRLHRRDLGERRRCLVRTRDPGRVACGAYHDEVVVHQVEARAAVALRHERLFGGLVVHQEEVGIAVPRKPQRLAGADRDDAHLDPGLGLEQRQQTVEEAGVLGGRGGSDGDEVAGARRRHCQHERERRCREPGNDAARAGASARGKGSHARRSRVA